MEDAAAGETVDAVDASVAADDPTESDEVVAITGLPGVVVDVSLAASSELGDDVAVVARRALESIFAIESVVGVALGAASGVVVGWTGPMVE